MYSTLLDWQGWRQENKNNELYCTLPPRVTEAISDLRPDQTLGPMTDIRKGEKA